MAFDNGFGSYSLMADKKYDSFQPQDVEPGFNLKINFFILPTLF